MATTMRGGGVEKEKRITSPSSSTIKRSPKPSLSTKTSSSSPSATKNSSTSECKSIPNYLKPTVSSTSDPSKTPKKSILDKPASKPTLDRRRSFDRPPPSSQVQKTVHNGPTTRDVKTLRSSSFSNKITTTPLAPSSSRRSATSTSASSRKVTVKGDPPVSKPGGLRRSTVTNNTVKDSNKGRPSSKKGPEKVIQEGASADCETPSDSNSMNGDHVLVNVDSEVESLSEISEMNETTNDLGDPTNIVLEVKQQPTQLDYTDIDTEDERHQEDDKLVVDEEHSDEKIQETTDDQKHIDIKKQDGAGENDEPEHRESNAEATKASIEDKEEEEPIKEEGEVNKEQQTESNSPIAATSTVVGSQPSWKKENQAYNDVIEETATKLRLKKNKVLALAGAFETVISLQDTNSR